MNVAELFVKLGVKGADESKRQLTGVSSGLKNITSSSLEAKAMILGVVYGMQRLMSGAIESAKSFSNFSDLTGVSSERLQRWQYAAKMVGVSSEDVLSGFKSVQSVMTDIMLGKNIPEGWGLFMDTVMPDPSRLRDTEYMMMKLQEFAQAMPADVGNKFLGNLGFNESMIIASRRNAFREDVFAKAPIMSTGQQKALRDMGMMLDNLTQKLNLMMAGVFSKHGPKLVKDFTVIAGEVAKLISQLLVLAEKVYVFEAIAKSMKGLTEIVKSLIELVKWIGSDKSITEKAKETGSFLGDVGGFLLENMSNLGAGINNAVVGEERMALINGKVNDITEKIKTAITPEMSSPSRMAKINNNDIKNSLVVNVGDRADVPQITNAIQKQLTGFYNATNANLVEN